MTYPKKEPGGRISMVYVGGSRGLENTLKNGNIESYYLLYQLHNYIYKLHILCIQNTT